MSLDQAIYSRTAEVVDPTPVWMWVVPQGEGYPCVVYAPINDLPSHDHDGITSYRRAKYQIDCYAESPTEVRALSAKVAGGWAFFTGELEGVVIIRAKAEAAEPAEELARDGRSFRRRLTLTVEYVAN